MKAGLVGYALVGKTTLFNALTGMHREGAAAHGHANLGAIKVPDPRVDALSDIYRPRKKTYAEMSFVILPGGSRVSGWRRISAGPAAAVARFRRRVGAGRHGFGRKATRPLAQRAWQRQRGVPRTVAPGGAPRGRTTASHDALERRGRERDGSLSFSLTPTDARGG